MKHLTLLSLFLAVFACSSKIHDVPNNELGIKEKLEKYLATCEEEGFSGTVLVEKEGEILISAGYGKLRKKSDLANTAEAIFDIGSITKQFTATAILVLEMQNKLSVEDRIGKYLPKLNEEKAKISIHQLLTHTAGFKGALGRDRELISDIDFIQKVNESKLIFSPGEKYDYSNVGYTLLGIIIERISGEAYEEFLRNNLFLPAGMKQTGYVLPDWDKANMAYGYKVDELPIDQNWNEEGPGWHLKGNGGILSTIGDMYAWHKALLSDKILNESAKKKLYTKHTPEYDNTSFYGYGWAIFPTSRGTELVTHNGGNGVFFADFWRYFDEEVVIIVLSNRANDLSDRLAGQIRKIVIP